MKSDGFDWQRSRVWLPSHAERLLLVLALTAFWALATSTLVWHLFPLTQRQSRLSCFRLGLDRLFPLFRAPKPVPLQLYFVPDTPSLTTVVL